MLETTLVIRILGRVNEVIGWAEVTAVARGDGRLWVDQPTFVPVTRYGVVRTLSVHWRDVNVEIRSEIESQSVRAGEVFELPGNWPAITVGKPAQGLPEVESKGDFAYGAAGRMH